MSPTSPALMTSKLKLHGRKPSFTNKVSWLARASSSSSNSSSSAPYGKVSRPMRISEPRFFDNGGAPAVERGGPLGSGAQIVRTPQEALEGETASFEHRSDSGRGSALHEAIAELVEGSDEMLPSTDKRGVSRRTSDPNDSESDYGEEQEEDFPENITTHSSSLGHGRHSGGAIGSEDGHRVPPAYSPPRRPLSVSKSTPCLVPPRPPPKGAIPPLPVDAKVAPLKLKHVAITPPPPFTQQPLPTPPLPTSLASPTPQPKFDCILLASDVSSRVPVDPSRVIVTVETESSSFRTTLATLTSRESHLGTFLLNLLTPPATEPQEQPRDVDDENTDEDAEDRGMSLRMRFRDDDGDETEEEDHRHLRMPSIFKSHLAASGLIPPSPITPAQSQQPPSITHMHIFLDRASEPYEHVLTYLRSPEDQIPYLPPALQLLPHTPTSTATFIAVRDEAHFLGLRDLVTLCTTALRERYAPVAPPLPPRPMARTLSNVSRPTHSRNGSASSSMTHGAHAEARDSVDSASSLSAGMKVTFAATHRRLASRERLQVTGPDGVIIPPHPNNNIVGPPPPPGEKFQTVRVRRAAAWV